MMTRILGSTIVAIVLLCAARYQAHAYPHFYKNVEARPLVRTYHLSWKSGWKTIETKNLGPTSEGICLAPDTFMVVTRPDGRSFSNDNCEPGYVRAAPRSFSSFFKLARVPYFGSSKRSCQRIYSAQPGIWSVTVFAAKPYTCGTADLFIDGKKHRSTFEFGGTTIAIGTQPDRMYSLQTVHIPGGATDTKMVLYNANWQEKKFDDRHGYGDAAKISYEVDSGDRLIVGSASLGTSGYTSVVVNECLFSPDAPRIDRERCWHSGLDRDRDGLSDGLEAEVGTDPNFHDTDRDGLFDYFEVVGRGVPGAAEIELPRLGANPLRRDLFVEFDRNIGTRPFREIEIARMFAVFDDLPSLSPNPDGSSGIVFHADTGAQCVDGTLCGDWGGSNELDEPAKYVRDLGAVSQNFSPTRQGIFHYAYVGPWSGGGAFVGTSTLWANRAGCFVIHELGHNLGLEHWGDAMSPSEQMNVRSAYPSAMNYAYQCEIPNTTDKRSRFSEGRLERIDPAAMNERSYSPGQSKSYLTGGPFLYRVEGDRVDFNRDFRFNEPNTENTVAFDTAPIGRDYFRAGWPDFQGTQVIGQRTPTGGGALAIQPLWTSSDMTRSWAFVPFRHANGAVYPDYATVLNVPDGPTQNWSDWAEGAYLDGHPQGESTALAFDNGQGPRILLLFPDRQGVLQYRFVDPSRPDTGEWRPIPEWPSGVRVLQASATVVDDHVEVVWADNHTNTSNNNVYLAKLRESTTWDTPRLLPGLAALFTPGIAQAANGVTYLAQVDRGDRQLRFYRRETASASWSWEPNLGIMPAFSGDDQDGEVPLGQRRRMQLLFLPYANGNGDAFADGSGYLAIFWNAGTESGNKENWLNLRAYTQGFATKDRNTLGRPPGSIFQTYTARPSPGYSIAVARRGVHATMIYTGIDWNDGAAGAPVYLPYANGIPSRSTGLNVDNDDAATISKNLCTSSWNFVKGFRGATCFCEFMDRTDVQCGPTVSAPVEAQWVTCEGK